MPGMTMARLQQAVRDAGYARCYIKEVFAIVIVVCIGFDGKGGGMHFVKTWIEENRAMGVHIEAFSEGEAGEALLQARVRELRHRETEESLRRDVKAWRTLAQIAIATMLIGFVLWAAFS